MWSWAGRHYRRRIVNVNINILLAGIMAIALTAIPVHFSRHFGVTDDHKVTILVITLVADVIFDFVIYFGLHWLANHWPQRWENTRRLVERASSASDDAPPRISFFRDAGIVQLQRAALGPLLYIVAVGIQFALMHADADRVLAGAVGYAAGMLITRVIHTAWMLRDQRRADAQAAHAAALRAALPPSQPTPSIPADLPRPRPAAFAPSRAAS